MGEGKIILPDFFKELAVRSKWASICLFLCIFNQPSFAWAKEEGVKILQPSEIVSLYEYLSRSPSGAGVKNKKRLDKVKSILNLDSFATPDIEFLSIYPKSKDFIQDSDLERSIFSSFELPFGSEDIPQIFSRLEEDVRSSSKSEKNSLQIVAKKIFFEKSKHSKKEISEFLAAVSLLQSEKFSRGNYGVFLGVVCKVNISELEADLIRINPENLKLSLDLFLLLRRYADAGSAVTFEVDAVVFDFKTHKVVAVGEVKRTGTRNNISDSHRQLKRFRSLTRLYDPNCKRYVQH